MFGFGGGGYGAVLCHGVVMYLDGLPPLLGPLRSRGPGGIVLIMGGDVRRRAQPVWITPANLAVLKNGCAKAVPLAALAALCEVLESSRSGSYGTVVKGKWSARLPWRSSAVPPEFPVNSDLSCTGHCPRYRRHCISCERW